MTLEELLLEKWLFLWIWISIDDELFLSEDCWRPLWLRLNELFLEPWLLLLVLKAGEGEAVEGGDSLSPPAIAAPTAHDAPEQARTLKPRPPLATVHSLAGGAARASAGRILSEIERKLNSLIWHFTF